MACASGVSGPVVSALGPRRVPSPPLGRGGVFKAVGGLWAGGGRGQALANVAHTAEQQGAGGPQLQTALATIADLELR